MRELTEHDKQLIIDSIPESDLVLFCPGLQGHGNTLIDRSQSANHGTINGALWGRTAKGVDFLSYDAIDDYTDCGDDASLQVEQGAKCSLFCWWYAAMLPLPGSWSFAFGAEQAGSLGFGIRAGVVQATKMGVADAPASSLVPTINKWNFIGMSWDKTNITYFLNDASEVQAYADPGFVTRHRWIGNAWFSFFACKIAIPRISGSEVSVAEALRRYKRERHWLGA
jgi:hypothetical protein